MLTVDIGFPKIPFARADEFLVDTGAGNTVINARLLGLDPADLGKVQARDHRHRRGAVDAWIVSDAVLRIESNKGTVTDVTPSLVLAIDDEFAPHLLGRSVLIEGRLKMMFDARGREFYLRR